MRGLHDSLSCTQSGLFCDSTHSLAIDVLFFFGVFQVQHPNGMLPQVAIWCLESDWMRSAICLGRFWFWVWFLWQIIAWPSNSESLTVLPFTSLAFSLWSNVRNVHTQWGCNVKALTFKTLGHCYFAWDMELQRWFMMLWHCVDRWLTWMYTMHIHWQMTLYLKYCLIFTQRRLVSCWRLQLEPKNFGKKVSILLLWWGPELELRIPVKLIPSYSFDCHYISDVKVLCLIWSIVKVLKDFHTSDLDGVE